ATSKGYFLRKDGRAFDHPDYYAHPDQYVSEFYAKVAPYLSLLLHGARCAPAYPRVMTNEQPTTALEIARTLGEGRFACVGDISCDVNGGLEFLSQYATRICRRSRWWPCRGFAAGRTCSCLLRAMFWRIPSG
ncbi:hypothetical protein DICSQDRAFT_174897, partial [Dichomitus squalens LYAD-421 SS1]